MKDAALRIFAFLILNSSTYVTKLGCVYGASPCSETFRRLWCDSIVSLLNSLNFPADSTLTQLVESELKQKLLMTRVGFVVCREPRRISLYVALPPSRPQPIGSRKQLEPRSRSAAGLDLSFAGSQGEDRCMWRCPRPGLNPSGLVNNSGLAVGPQFTEVKMM